MIMQLYAIIYFMILTFIFGGAVVVNLYQNDSSMTKADVWAIMIVITYIPILLKIVS